MKAERADSKMQQSRIDGIIYVTVVTIDKTHAAGDQI
jgi:hypothetical protein